MPITRGRVGKAPLSPLVAAAAVVVSFSWVDGRMNGRDGTGRQKAAATVFAISDES